MKSILPLLLLVTYASAQTCSISSRLPGTRNETCGNLRFVVSVPSSGCAPNQCGLIFDVHGYSMSTESQNGETKLRQLGTDAGYVVVHPQANGLFLPSWSAADDPTVFNMVLSAANFFDVDRNRIHFGGFSQGGWMTYRMVCNTALNPRPNEVIASFGPIAAGFGGSAASCFGAGGGPPVKVIHTHGRADALVSFNEALRAVNDISLAQASDPGRTEQTLVNTTFYDHVRRTGNGIVFETIFHEQGHYIISDSVSSVVYGRSGPFNTGEEILKFYQAHPLGVKDGY